MKHASILLLAIGLCGLSFAACAEGDETQFGNKPSGGAGGGGGESGEGGGIAMTSSSSSSASSASSSSSSGGSGICAVMCSSDADCQSMCAVPPQGINCCDVGTGTCYVSGGSSCPSASSSSGTMY